MSWKMSMPFLFRGFGQRGTEGKIKAVQFARERRFHILVSVSECKWR